MKKILAALLLVSGLVYGESTKTVYNPFTGKQDYITAVNSQNFASGSGVTVSCTNGVCTFVGGGGGTSSLQVTRSGVQITSPTASLNLYSGDFLANVVGGATAQIYLNPATTDFYSPLNVPVSTITASSLGVLTLSSATATYLSKPEAASTYLTQSSATLTYCNANGTNCTAGTTLPAGATNYIQNTSSLQSGATFYLSSGTVTTLNTTNIKRSGAGSIGLYSNLQKEVDIGSAQVGVTSNLWTGTNVALGYGKTEQNALDVVGYTSIGYTDGSIPVLSGSDILNVNGNVIGSGVRDTSLTNKSVIGTDGSGNLIAGSLPTGSTNYIQNTQTLQSGATFYVSSGTVFNSFTTQGSVKMNTPITIFQPSAGSNTSEIDFTNLFNNNNSNIKQRWVSGTGINFPLVLSNTNNSDSTAFSTFYVDPTYGVSVVGSTNNVRAFSIGNTLGGPYNFAISTMGAVQLSGSEGTNGQVFTSAGPNTVPTWTTVSGGTGGSGYAVQPATVSFNLAQGVTGTTGTWTGGITASSITVNGSGNGSIQLTIAGSTYGVVGASITPIVGQYLVWTSTNYGVGLSTGTGSGGGGGSPASPTNSVQYNGGGSFAGSNNFQFNGTSVTILSSTSFGTAGVGNNDFVGYVNIYPPESSVFAGQYLFTVGDINGKDELFVQDGQPVNMVLRGSKSGNILVGDSVTDSNQNSITNGSHSSLNRITFFDGTNNSQTYQTPDSGNGSGDFIWKPGTVEQMRLGNAGALTLTSSATFNGTVALSSGLVTNGSAGTNGQVLTSGGAGTKPSWTTVSGTGDMILASTQTVSGAKTFTSSVTFSSYTIISSSGTGNALKANVAGNFGTSDGTSGGVLFTDADQKSQGPVLQIYSDQGVQNALTAPLYLVQNNTAADNPNIYVVAKGTSPQNGIRLDGADYSTIALIDTLRSSASKNGKFQLSSHNNELRGERRNAANNAFESAWLVDSSTGAGIMFIGTDYSRPVSTMDVQGGVTIGAGIAGVTASPTSGLLVQGNSIFQASMTVAGASTFTSSLTVQGILAGQTITAIAASTAAIASSTTTLQTGLNNVATSTATIATSTTSIGSLVNTLGISTASVYALANGKVGLSSITATSPITYNNTTGGIGFTQNFSTLTLTSTFTVTYATINFNAVNYSWPSSGTVGNYLMYTATNTLQWGSVAASGGSGSGYAVAPATVAFNLAQGVQGTTMSFTAFNTTTTSATVTGSAGLAVTGSSLLANATFYSTNPSTSAIVVMSTNNVQVFAVSNSSVTAGDYMLAISSTPGTSPPIVFGVNTYSHVVSSGAAPSMGTCGTSPSVDGTDFAGVISVGSGVVTACTINFSGAFVRNPVCVVSDNSTTVTASLGTISTTAVTFNTSATLGSGLIYYICVGNKG